MTLDPADMKAFDACARIVTLASLHMDANDADALVRLFTEDLEFVRPSTYPDVAIRGRAELHAAIAERDRHMVSRHIASNIAPYRVSADRIVVKSYFTHFRGWRDIGSDEPIPITETLRSMGEYEDHLVCADGEWLIARRVAKFLFGGL
ncbi:nuclear transport factor 2 family protein [Sphingobium chlorophenolicum]|uniref:Arginine deiminase n=1 Tax=Sphingobium chlorophenolicum TaxID=46429 RepID=A0A081RFD2_SPHCR|nr:nuclear transport factor 2 family protein [Sphingobium chlorophenolicum]KEQ53905.1 Arginine deiminase [Sphingobium chlorophenolicum]